MANNLIQIRRTSVAGREANTETLPNVGELALNILDGRMFSTNGEVIFEIGANTKNSRVSNSFYVGNDSINTTANSTQIGTSIIQLTTAAYVGDNVDLTTTGLMIGNTTVNLVTNSTSITLANSTVTWSVTKPTEAQVSAGDYYLSSDGVWEQLAPGADPAGANTEIQYNLSGDLGANNLFTFDYLTSTLSIGGTTNVVANTSTIKLSNSTVNTQLSIPTTVQYSATNYFLHANGSWVQITGGEGSVYVYQKFIATAGQTDFTISGGFTPNEVQVYENGVHLANDEYTANGSHVVLGTGSLEGAIVEVTGYIALSSFTPVAAGSNTQVQVNDSGSFSGFAGLTFNKTTNNVLIANTLTIGTATINSTNYSQTSNNALYLDGTAASGYQTTAGLSANVATLSANNSAYLGGTAAADYQTEAGLADNVATMSANNASYLGGTAAASYALDTDLDAYQTEAGLSDNVATMSANNAAYLGGTAAASYALDTDLDAYQTEAGLSANVATLAANSATYVPVTNGIVSNSGGLWIIANNGLVVNTTGLHVGTGNGIVIDADAVSVLANTGIVVNATGVFVNATYIGTLSANNASYLGGTAAGSYALDTDLDAYQTEAGLSDNVATLTANNSTNFAGQSQSYYANVTAPVFSTSVNSAAVYVTSQINAASHTSGTGFVANTTGVYANSVVNAASHTGTGFTANSLGVYANSVVNAASHTGTGFTANSLGVYANSVVNAASHTGTGFTANSLGVYANSVVNSASFTVGTSTIVNSSMVSVTAGSLLSANIQVTACTTTSYTLLATDSGKIVTMDNGSAMTVTIPAGLPIGFRCQVMRKGAGTCTLSNTGQTGCTLHSRTGAYAITAQWGSASIFEEAANSYVIDGLI